MRLNRFAARIRMDTSLRKKVKAEKKVVDGFEKELEEVKETKRAGYLEAVYHLFDGIETWARDVFGAGRESVGDAFSHRSRRFCAMRISGAGNF